MNFVFFRLAQVVQLRISNTPSLMSRFDGDNILVVGIRNSASLVYLSVAHPPKYP